MALKETCPIIFISGSYVSIATDGPLQNNGALVWAPYTRNNWVCFNVPRLDWSSLHLLVSPSTNYRSFFSRKLENQDRKIPYIGRWRVVYATKLIQLELGSHSWCCYTYQLHQYLSKGLNSNCKARCLISFQVKLQGEKKKKKHGDEEADWELNARHLQVHSF